MPLAGLILAAGASTRMGAPKAIMPWGEETFLQAISAKMRGAGVAPLFVILGAHYREVRHHARSCGALPIYNDRWASGQFGSLRLGLSRLSGSAAKMAYTILPAAINGVMVALIDQPHIQKDVFVEIARVGRQFPDKLIIPSCHRRRGHPVVIPRRFWPGLMAMPSTSTTRDFMNAHQDQQLLVPVADEGVYVDLDSPEQWLLAKMRYHV